MTEHLVGLLLGIEEDWPRTFEALLGLLGPIESDEGETRRGPSLGR